MTLSNVAVETAQKKRFNQIKNFNFTLSV